MLVDIARLVERFNMHSHSRAWKLDIKRREPGILFISLHIVSLFKLSIMMLLLSFMSIQCYWRHHSKSAMSS